MSLAEQPRNERHATAGAHPVLVGLLGLVDPVRHTGLRPGGSGGEIGECIRADHGGAPAGERLAGAVATQASVHRALAQLGLEQSDLTVWTPVGGVDLDCVAGGEVTSTVIGAAGAVGGASNCVHDDVDRTA